MGAGVSDDFPDILPGTWELLSQPWMDEWAEGWMCQWCVGERTDEWVGGWMGGQMDECVGR